MVDDDQVLSIDYWLSMVFYERESGSKDNTSSWYDYRHSFWIEAVVNTSVAGVATHVTRE